jgi:hypothetical protein
VSRTLTKLLKACEGKGSFERRDTAHGHHSVVCRYTDTPQQLAALRVTDIDFDHAVVYVMGMGRRPPSQAARCEAR